MTDKQLFELIDNELFKTGSCKPSQWFTIDITYENKRILLEAMLPSKGNLRIRKPVKKYRINQEGEQIYLYQVYRFTNKRELKDDGFMEGLRSEVKELVS